MSERWYYSHGGAIRGPASAAELQRLVHAGGLLPTDMIWPVGVDPTGAVPAEAALRFPTSSPESTTAASAPAPVPDWLPGLIRAIKAVDNPASLPGPPPSVWLADVRRAEERGKTDPPTR